MSIARPVMQVDARAHYKGVHDIRLGRLHAPGQLQNDGYAYIGGF